MNDTRNLVAALAGAVAESIDLGPRGSQIHRIGFDLELSIDALHLELADLDAEARIGFVGLDLDQLSRCSVPAFGGVGLTEPHLVSRRLVGLDQAAKAWTS